jgi:hypothetical protein
VSRSTAAGVHPNAAVDDGGQRQAQDVGVDAHADGVV